MLEKVCKETRRACKAMHLLYTLLTGNTFEYGHLEFLSMDHQCLHLTQCTSQYFDCKDNINMYEGDGSAVFKAYSLSIKMSVSSNLITR